jgi:hypothetical protein
MSFQSMLPSKRVNKIFIHGNEWRQRRWLMVSRAIAVAVAVAMVMAVMVTVMMVAVAKAAVVVARVRAVAVRILGEFCW